MCNQNCAVLVPIPTFLEPYVYFNADHPEFGIDEQGRRCLAIDACMVDALLALWDREIPTISACCLHGEGEGVITLPRVVEPGTELPKPNWLQRDEALDRLEASEQEAARLRAERDAANARYAEQVQRLQAAIEQAKEYPCPACGHRLMVACGHDALGATTAPEPERATVARLRADLAASETPYLKLKAFLRSVAERVVRIEGCAGCRELGMAIRVAVVTDWALPTPEDMAAARRVVEALAATTAPEAERAGPE
jgi:hypothetical protein